MHFFYNARTCSSRSFIINRLSDLLDMCLRFWYCHGDLVLCSLSEQQYRSSCIFLKSLLFWLIWGKCIFLHAIGILVSFGSNLFLLKDFTSHCFYNLCLANFCYFLTGQRETFWRRPDDSMSGIISKTKCQCKV